MRLFIVLGLIGLSFLNGCAMRSHSLSTPTVNVDRTEILTLLLIIDQPFYEATKDILNKYSLSKLKRLCLSYKAPSRNFKEFQRACKQLVSTPLKGTDFERTNRMLMVIDISMARLNTNFVGVYIHPSEGRPSFTSEDCSLKGNRFLSQNGTWIFQYETEGWCSTEDKEKLKWQLPIK